MTSFDLVSKLILILGISGGVYTVVYALWARRTSSSGAPRMPDAEASNPSKDKR